MKSNLRLASGVRRATLPTDRPAIVGGPSALASESLEFDLLAAVAAERAEIQRASGESVH